MASDAESEVIVSVERGLAVLAAFRPERPAMTLSEVARATELDRASVRRFLYTLLARGYLRTDGSQFRLRPAVLELGNAYLACLRLPSLAQPVLTALAGRFHEAASLAVLEGDRVVHVAHVPSGRLMGAEIAVGSQTPAHANAAGRVLLAGRSDEWLDGYLTALDPGRVTDVLDPNVLRTQIAHARRHGWLRADDEGGEHGVRSVAAPVRDVDGVTVAAISMTLHAGRTSDSELADTVGPALLDAADAIARASSGASRSRDDLPEDAGQLARPRSEG